MGVERKHQKLVFIGGGTGNYNALIGAVTHNQPECITALVGTWDSGGSSGRLRTQDGLLPMGDARQCLAALAEDPEQRRVILPMLNDRSIDDHSFGNLMFKVLRNIYHGDQDALDKARVVFRVKSDIVYVSPMLVTLNARYQSGLEIEGEDGIDMRWRRSDYDPEDSTALIYFNARAEPSPRALRAIEEADKIIFSPGSLYGSILPHLLVDGMPEAVISSKALVIFVQNLMTEKGQTDLFKPSDHLSPFVDYLGDKNRLNHMIVNDNSLDPRVLQFYKQEGQQPVLLDDEEEVRCRELAPNLKISKVPLASYLRREHLLRHDPDFLAQTILELS